MTDKESLRQTALASTDAFGEKRRFGLFSQPISTAIGDDGPYKTKLHPRDDNGQGKPITDPKNFYSGPCRSGQLKKSFFSDLNSLAASDVKDEYIQLPKRLLKEENQNFKKGFKNENKFKPPTGTGSNILAKASYQYTEDKRPDLDPKRNRQDDGRVKTKPRNYYTNQQSTVINNYFKPLKHMDDPYNRAHQIALENQMRNKSLQGEAKFRPNSFHAQTFSKDKEVYDLSEDLKPKEQKGTKFNIFNHQNKWKRSSPNKSGLYGYFTSFPKYMENPPKQITRKPSSEKKDVFKSMSSTLTVPSSSIVKNPINMRKYVGGHSFSLHK